MKSKLKILLALWLVMSTYAFAGTKWDIKIINRVNNASFEIAVLSANCWYTTGFSSGRDSVAAANDQ